MISIILTMLFGIAMGITLRKKQIKHVNRIITVLIWALLFLLGISVGSNKMILSNFASLGIEAFIISVSGILGSLIFAWILGKYLSRNSIKKGKG